MRPLLTIAVVSAFYCCSPVFAQVGMGTTYASARRYLAAR